MVCPQNNQKHRYATHDIHKLISVFCLSLHHNTSQTQFFSTSSELTPTRYESRSFYVLSFSNEAFILHEFKQSCLRLGVLLPALLKYISEPALIWRTAIPECCTPDIRPLASGARGNNPPAGRSPDKTQPPRPPFSCTSRRGVERITLLRKLHDFRIRFRRNTPRIHRALDPS